MAPLVCAGSLVAIICVSLTTALPSPIHDFNKNNTAPSSAPVVWFQAPEGATDGACGSGGSHGILQADKCYALHTAAMGIQQASKFDCTFKVWNDMSDCTGNGSWTATAIPRGRATTCIYDIVLDGGRFQHKSGIYSCD